jgi:sugar phosphate permease
MSGPKQTAFSAEAAAEANLATRAASAQAGTSSASPYRWVVLGIAFAAFLVTFLDRLAWANANLLAGKSLGIPIAALGVFVTAFYIGYVAASALGGFVADRIGPRRMLVLALTPLAAATFLFGFTNSFATGVALQGLMGLFAGVDYAACVKIVASWFKSSERGRALGLFSTAPSIGVALANAVFPVLLGSFDWRPLYWALGCLTAAVALLCRFALSDSPVTQSGEARPANHAAASTRASTLWRDKNLVLIAVAGFGANWGTWGFAFWAAALMIRGYGLSAVDAGLVAVIFGVAAAVSKPLYGFLSDQLGGRRRDLVIYDLLAFSAMLVLFGQMGTKTRFILAAPCLGLTAVVYSPLLAAMITERVDASHVASAIGMINAFWQLGSVIVPSVVGLVFAATGSFQAAFAILAAGPLIGTFCMLAVRETS